VQLWWLVQSTLFAWSPQPLYAWRRMLLRIFGAKVGRGVLIRASAKITFPWNLEFEEYAWVGDEVVLYSLAPIKIGNHVVVSQRSYLCTGSHNYMKETFDTEVAEIHLSDGVWLATDVFVSPGVSIGEGTVVGARSSVFSSLPENMICVGSPAKPVRKRVDV